MPKGHKRKNPGVGVDFKRAKHQVGKKLPRAQNATDTTVKSRAISLPEQSVTADRAGAATTHRKLTLKELLRQCVHYSERVRHDALGGLSELVKAHPEELRRNATAVVSAAAERIADADAACRAATLSLLRSALLPALGPQALQPFAPLLMAHVCSAMTHLAEPIRTDSLSFLSVLMEVRPDLVAAGYVTQVLQHFGAAVARPARGRSLEAGSLAALLSLVGSLQSFLAKALPALQPGSTASGDAPEPSDVLDALDAVDSQATGSGGGEGQAVPLLSMRCAWPPAVSAAGSGGAAAAAEREAARALLSLLADCWGECGAAELAARPELAPAQCATALLRCCDMMLAHWGPELAGDLSSKGSLATALLAKIAPHFPVRAPSVPVTPATREQMVQLNVAAAQLLAHFLPAGMASRGSHQLQLPPGWVHLQHAQRPVRAVGPAGAGSEGPAWVTRLLDWLSEVMSQGAALPASADDVVGPESMQQQHGGQPFQQQAAGKRAQGKGRAGREGQGKSELPGGSGGDGGGRKASVPAEVYATALGGVRRILPLLSPPRRRQMLGAAWALWGRSAVRSAARARVLAFLAALLSDPAGSLYAPLPPTGDPLVLQEEAAAWVAAMPKFLWELGGGTRVAATQRAVLRLLLDAARFAPSSGPLAAALSTLPPQLAPLFCVLVPKSQRRATGGAQTAAAAAGHAEATMAMVLHLGPLCSAPLSTQELAVDVLYHLPGTPDPLLKAAALLCLGQAYPVSTALRLVEVLGRKASEAEASGYWGLLLTLTAGTSKAGVERQAGEGGAVWQRHQTVCAVACRAAMNYAGGAAAALEALGPPLLALCRADEPPASPGEAGGKARPAYGCLQLSLMALKAGSGAADAAGASSRSVLPRELQSELPTVMLRLVRECCTQRDLGADVLPADEAAALAASVVAVAPHLLAATLSCISLAAAEAQPEQAGLAEGPEVTLMLALAKEPQLAEQWVADSEVARAALAAVVAAVDCSRAVVQLTALMTNLLGQDLMGD